MALMPKRVKHRKSQRGRIKGNATRGNRVVFGEFGLQATQGGWVSAQTIEAGRVAATQYIRGEGRLYVRIFPHKSVTSIPLSTLRAKIDYGFVEASTAQGNIGVQVWINQGMYEDETDGADAQEGQAPKKPKRTYKR